MRKVKIAFTGFWDSFDVEDNIFTNLLRVNYQVEVSEKPEIVFFSVFRPKIPNGDCKRVLYIGENIRPDFSSCDWAFGFDYEETIPEKTYMRMPISIFEGDVEPLLLTEENDVNDRKKFCNFLYWKEVEFREQFFRRLSKYRHIDSPGKSMNNQKAIGMSLREKIMRKFKLSASDHDESIFKSRTSNNWQSDKLPFLSKYKFTLAFENSSFPGYFTEKIVHPMIAGSIPIYWGNPEIARDFNSKSFLNYHDFENEEEFIQRIIAVDKNRELYMQMLKEPWFIDNRRPEWADKQRIVGRLVEIVEQ